MESTAFETRKWNVCTCLAVNLGESNPGFTTSLYIFPLYTHAMLKFVQALQVCVRKEDFDAVCPAKFAAAPISVNPSDLVVTTLGFLVVSPGYYLSLSLFRCLRRRGRGYRWHSEKHEILQGASLKRLWVAYIYTTKVVETGRRSGFLGNFELDTFVDEILVKFCFFKILSTWKLFKRTHLEIFLRIH